jgi:signal transduction histidine kinase
LGNIDTFHDSVLAFERSGTYRFYRFLPSHDAKRIFSPSQPVEIPEIFSTLELTLAFRESLVKGDWEQAQALSGNISVSLINLLLLGGEVERFTAAAYLRLLVLFVTFIFLAIVIIFVFEKALIRSRRKETEDAGFSNDILIAQEKERSRISRELHDTIAQDLRYLSLGMNKIGRTEDKTAREKLCNDAALMQSDLIRKVRDICDYLVPPDFKFQGLGDALRRLCLDFGTRTGIDCRIEISEEMKPDFLTEEKQLQVFRIVQEALANVEQHTKATEAIVTMRSADGEVFIGISDDGKGFELNQSGKPDSKTLGIRSMKQRAALLGGSLEIKTEPGEGTMVRLRFPEGG